VWLKLSTAFDDLHWEALDWGEEYAEALKKESQESLSFQGQVWKRIINESSPTMIEYWGRFYIKSLEAAMQLIEQTIQDAKKHSAFASRVLNR
jgi:hypothetical protein